MRRVPRLTPPVRVVIAARTPAGAGQSGCRIPGAGIRRPPRRGRASAPRRARENPPAAAPRPRPRGRRGDAESRASPHAAPGGGIRAAPSRARASRRAGSRAAAVDRIADQRIARMRQVQADLVRAAGFERHAHPGVDAKALDDAVVRDGLAPARAHGHAHPIDRMPVDRRIDLAARGHHADADGLVLAMDLARGERLGKLDARGLRCARRPGARSCPCRAGARCRRAAALRAWGRARAARSAGSGRDCRRRDARRAPPACRRRSRPRPRRRSTTRFACATGSTASSSGASRATRSPPATISRGRGTRPSTRSQPSSIQRFSRDRENSGRAPASAWSRRRPAACGGNRSSRW